VVTVITEVYDKTRGQSPRDGVASIHKRVAAPLFWFTSKWNLPPHS